MATNSLLLCFENVSIIKDEDSQLGVGSYGAVYKAKCDQLPCAAKILHPAFFQSNDPGSKRIMERFKQECGFLSNIRHPHIVQYLGLRQDCDSRLPVLLMELLDSNLTDYLENSIKQLPYHTEIDICYGIVLAIAYLHSNGIIHRDLSGNNVLIAAGSKAKVTDFGMAQLVDTVSTSRHKLTFCPGTEVYMPPEAFKRPPVYTTKLDSFSVGVLIIQILTRLYPKPEPRTKEVPFLSSPTGVTEVPVFDMERRKDHIDSVHPAHPLLPVSKECLIYNQEERPSAQQLCEQLATLRESPVYSQSKQCEEKFIRELQQANDHLTRLLEEKDQIIQDKSKEIEAKDAAIRFKDFEIHMNHRELEYKQRAISHKDAMLRELNKQLQAIEQRIPDFQMSLNKLQLDCSHLVATKDVNISILKCRLQENEAMTSEFTAEEVAGLKETLSAKQHIINGLQQEIKKLTTEEPDNIMFTWKDCGKVPQNNCSFAPCPANGNIAYFRVRDRAQNLYSYNATDATWLELPKCPFRTFTLVTVGGLLTAIGLYALDSAETTELLSLVEQNGERNWRGLYPRMLSKRYAFAVVFSGHFLVVAGGFSTENNHIKSVEVLDVNSKRWHIVRTLPFPLSRASATVCGDNLYLVGGFDDNGLTNSALTCSLSALVRSTKPSSLRKRLTKTSSSTELVWSMIHGLPVAHTTCATLDGRLITVGGQSPDKTLTNAIHAYCPETNAWDEIGKMPTVRCHCLVAVLPGYRLLVAGGLNSSSDHVDAVEIGTFLGF